MDNIKNFKGYITNKCEVLIYKKDRVPKHKKERFMEIRGGSGKMVFQTHFIYGEHQVFINDKIALLKIKVMPYIKEYRYVLIDFFDYSFKVYSHTPFNTKTWIKINKRYEENEIHIGDDYIDLESNKTFRIIGMDEYRKGCKYA